MRTLVLVAATLVLGCCVVGPAVAAPAAGFEVPLSVTESAGVERLAAPISGGVPLPRGRFKADQPFTVTAEDGRALPAQVVPLVVETDGTLRWVLVDFQDDVAAGATNRYVLRAGGATVAPKTPLRIDSDPTGVAVDTGAIRFGVAKEKPFGLFDSVAIGGKRVVIGGEVGYEQLHGRTGWNDPSPWRRRTLGAGPPDSVKLHHFGPMRVTIEVAGRFADDPLGAGYKAWITAWSGRSDVLVKYKLCNSNPERYTALPVGRSLIALRLDRPGGKTLLGAKEPIEVGGEGWLHQGLFLHHTWQDIAGAVKAGDGADVLWTGNGPADRPAGWIAAGLGGSPVFACDKVFSADPARRLAVEGGRLVLEGVAERFEGPKDQKFDRDRRVGEPWKSQARWLFDCSHHSSEYLIDFAPADDPDALGQTAAASRNRLWLFASPDYYAAQDATGTGRFGSLEQEMAAYRAWGLKWDAKQLPDRVAPLPGACVTWEDNHYESEADSVQGLLLMYLRTGQRGWFDQAEAWAGYHMDLQAWRTDGWAWKDGAIWFPTGGPQGNMKTRADWNFAWGPDWGDRKGDLDCADLWRAAQAKSCYCHFYGSGLADYYCLSGDPDALAAAIDNVEQKDDEFRRYKKLKPGESDIGEIRGFGRGFEVMMRVLQADPGNEMIRALCRLSAETLWQSPLLDERGFHASGVGARGNMDQKLLSPPIRKWMEERSITATIRDGRVDTLTRGDRTWPVRAMGGTWQHIYVQNGADMYARCFDDEDMRDFTIAFAQMSAKFMLSPKCRQTWYYTYFDVPDLGMVFDPWAFEHTDTTDGVGCVHSGWYTRFYPDACAKGYTLTGERGLLEKAREFWYYGSKREYQRKEMLGAPDEVGRFASHTPPKDDTVLSTARLFAEATASRAETPPAAVTDLAVTLLGGGRAEVRFTAPRGAGGGPVARYQLKAAALPIAPYEQWDYARDLDKRRNWWRAANVAGEPTPAPPGSTERFEVAGVPEGATLYFALRSFDAEGNRSAMSNVAVARE
jgi:hypothetical protein